MFHLSKILEIKYIKYLYCKISIYLDHKERHSLINDWLYHIIQSTCFYWPKRDCFSHTYACPVRFFGCYHLLNCTTRQGPGGVICANQRGPLIPLYDGDVSFCPILQIAATQAPYWLLPSANWVRPPGARVELKCWTSHGLLSSISQIGRFVIIAIIC